MATKFKYAVLFDVDGTLIDSNYFHAVSWCQALRQSGFTVPTAEAHRAVGMGGKELVHHLLGSEVSKEQLETLLGAHDAIFSTHWAALVPFTGAKALLEHCRSAGAAVVLASSAQRAELDVLRKALDAENAITAATSSSDAKRGKPSPDILGAALESVGVDAAHALFIGDAVWDAQAAAALGLPMIGVCSGGTSEAELFDAGALEVYSDVQELLANVETSALAQLLRQEKITQARRNGPSGNRSYKPREDDKKESPMEAHEESQTAPESQDQEAAEASGKGRRGDDTTGQRGGAKNPDELPDGSGTDAHRTGSEQGQEDEGQSFDAG